MKKRIFGLLLVVCMLVGLLPMTAFAETDQPVFYLEYSAKDTGHTDGPIGVRAEMKAGDAPKYWVTGEFDAANYANVYFMQESTEANWNVKLEYPVDGIPTVTLKNAKISGVYRGLAFIGGGYQGVAGEGGVNGHSKSEEFNGDVKLILEGENHIDNCHRFAQILYFHVAGTATITGSGSLSINHSTNQNSYGIIHAKGDLVFDNTKVSIKVPSVESRHGMGIVAHGGDITVKGGKLFFDGHNQYPSGKGNVEYTKFRNIAYALWATKNADGKGGSFTAKDNADVQIYASHVNASVGYYKWTRSSGTTVTPQVRGMVRLDTALNISNSDVIFAVTSGTSSSSGGAIEVYNENLETKRIGLTLNFDFDDGYTMTIASGHTTIDDSTGTIKTPAGKGVANQPPDFSTAGTTPNFFKVTRGYDKDAVVDTDKDDETNKDDTNKDDGTQNDANTEPTTKPNTQPTPQPTTPAEDETPQDTAPSTPATEPAGTEATEAPEKTDPDTKNEKQGMSGLLIALIVVLSVAVVGGGVAIFVFIIKPKKAK